MRIVALVALSQLAAVSCFAQDITANAYLPGCKNVLNQPPPHNDLSIAFNQGKCLGIAIATLHLQTFTPSPFQICPPRNVTPGDAIRLMVQYVEEKPERMRESFMTSAQLALLRAWPCKK